MPNAQAMAGRVVHPRAVPGRARPCATRSGRAGRKHGLRLDTGIRACTKRQSCPVCCCPPVACTSRSHRSTLSYVSNFEYVEIDLSDQLPTTWSADLCFVAGRRAMERSLTPTSVTSREAPEVRSRPLLLVNGRVLREEAPWIYDLYQGIIRQHAEAYAGRPTYTAKRDIYAINLNVQWGDGMVYECHVDSNPIQGMLYTATLGPEDGGALVVSRNPEAKSIADVDKNCIEIYPKQDHLVLFDARTAPHYVRPMRGGHARVAVAMNFYTDDSPESARPVDLSTHLFGSEQTNG